MNDVAAFLKEPLKFQKGIYVFPPSVKQVVTESQFGAYRQLLTTSQEEIEDNYVEKGKSTENMLTPLETLLAMAFQQKQVHLLVKEAFKFFTGQDATLLFEQRSIVVGNLEELLPKIKNISELPIINNENFFTFQNLVREACGIKPIEPPNPNEHWKIKQMKARARYRDKIKAKQQSGLDLKSTLVAICCMGIGITPLNIGEMSYCAVSPIMRTFQEREKYEVDIKSVMAGAKKIKPKYWIRKIED